MQTVGAIEHPERITQVTFKCNSANSTGSARSRIGFAAVLGQEGRDLEFEGGPIVAPTSIAIARWRDREASASIGEAAGALGGRDVEELEHLLAAQGPYVEPSSKIDGRVRGRGASYGGA